jgi:hypothetical protein
MSEVAGDKDTAAGTASCSGTLVVVVDDDDEDVDTRGIAVTAVVTYLTARDEVLAIETGKDVVDVVQAVINENREGYLWARKNIVINKM